MNNEFNNSEELYKLYDGKGIDVSIGTDLVNFNDIILDFEKYKIKYTIINQANSKQKEKFSLRFNCETNFQNLFIIATILHEYGLISVDYWGDRNNEVYIGLPASKSMDIDTYLKIPFSTNIKDFLHDYFNVEISTIDIKIKKWIESTYNVEDGDNPTNDDISRIKEISIESSGFNCVETLNGLEIYSNIEVIELSDNKIENFDMSNFPNLKGLDISYNPVEKLNINKNKKLEYIRYEGLRGNRLPQIDFSGNSKLKKIIGGQDGLSQIELSNNFEIENIEIRLSSDLRYINLTNCSKLRRIRLWGVLIPFVNLTNNNNLEHVEINYLNEYKGKEDEYGKGYPRPVIFVNENFNENVINLEDRNNSYYCYVLVKVKKGSKEEKILQTLESMKSEILGIGKLNSDGFIPFSEIRLRDSNIANFHYYIMDLLNN